MTLIEAIRDRAAISRVAKGNRNLMAVASHSVLIELLRVLKVFALCFGVYMIGHTILRDWILACSAVAMGVSSILDLLFRHLMFKRLRTEWERENGKSQ